MKTKKKNTGRPRGSKTKDRVTVSVRPEHCPRCGSNEFTRDPGAPVRIMEYDGSIDGGEYDLIEWVNCHCKCGQSLRRAVYIKK